MSTAAASNVTSTAHANEEQGNFKYNFNTPIILLDKSEDKDQSIIASMRSKLEESHHF